MSFSSWKVTMFATIAIACLICQIKADFPFFPSVSSEILYENFASSKETQQYDRQYNQEKQQPHQIFHVFQTFSKSHNQCIKDQYSMNGSSFSIQETNSTTTPATETTIVDKKTRRPVDYTQFVGPIVVLGEGITFGPVYLVWYASHIPGVLFFSWRDFLCLIITGITSILHQIVFVIWLFNMMPITDHLFHMIPFLQLTHTIAFSFVHGSIMKRLTDIQIQQQREFQMTYYPPKARFF